MPKIMVVWSITKKSGNQKRYFNNILIIILININNYIFYEYIKY